MRNEKLQGAVFGAGFILVGFLAASLTGTSSVRAGADLGAASTPLGAPPFEVQGGRAGQAAPANVPRVFAHKGREIPGSIDEILHPKHTVLVVHEMLNTFISEGGAYDKAGRRYDLGRMAKILPGIKKLLETAHAKNVRVAYLRYTSTADASSSSVPQTRSSYLRTGQPPQPAGDVGTVDGSWGWQNIDEVKPVAGDWIIRKYRPNGFYGTPLDALLRWNEIKTFIMVGIGGEVGYLPTMETASEIGYFTVAIEDGVLSSNATRQEALMPFIADHAMMMKSGDVVASWNKQ